MPILNNDAVLPDEDRRTFRCEPAEITLPAATELYKYSRDGGLYRPDGSVTPYWFAANPTWPNDPGLDVHLERAERLGVHPGELARAGAAVPTSDMDTLLRIRLTGAMKAWKGPARWQDVRGYRRDEGKVVFIGGRIQLYIPGLNSGNLVIVT